MSRVENPRYKEQAQHMADLYRSGKTLQQIGDEYRVTRERVRQLVKFFFGVTRKDSPRPKATLARAMATARDKRELRRIRDEARYQTYLGCSADFYKEVTGQEWNWTIFGRGKNRAKRNPGTAYINQARNARRRSIEWAISFPEWWRIWQESGKWEQRGRGKGYCMARYGDSGPYAVGNVYICTVGQNFSDSYLVRPWKERFPNGHHRSPSHGRGFSIAHTKKSKDRPYQLYLGKKYGGLFPSRESAERAALHALAAR